MNDAGRNGVDADAAVGNFLRQGAGEGVDGAFGGAVGHFAGGGVAAPDGAEVDDDAFLAGEHLWQHGTGAVEGTMHIGVKEIEPFGVEHVLQQAVPTDAGAVDEHIDAAAVLAHGIDDELHLGRLANVALHADNVAAFGLEHAAEAAGGFDAFFINEADVVAIAGEPAHGGCADAAGAAGDEDVSHIVGPPCDQSVVVFGDVADGGAGDAEKIVRRKAHLYPAMAGGDEDFADLFDLLANVGRKGFLHADG